MYRRNIIVLVAVALLVAAGLIIVDVTTPRIGDVTRTQRERMLAAIRQRDAGAKLVKFACGKFGRVGGCSFFVRRAGSERCDGWIATFGANDRILLSRGLSMSKC